MQFIKIFFYYFSSANIIINPNLILKMKKLLLFFVLMLSFNLLQAQAVPRDMVVLEIATGTWCQYCPGASMGADDLIANGCRVAVIENHNGDAYDNNYSNARNSYYNVTGYPTSKFDGVQSIVGGSHTVSSYPSFLPKYNLRKAVPSQVTIEYTMTQTGRHFDFVFTITKVATLPNNILAFQFTVTQSEIMVNWQGQNHLNYVDRRMVPNQSGTSLDFTSTDVKTVNIGCDIDPLWPMEDIEFVAFVQNNTGKEILQGIRPVLLDFESTTPTTFCQSENAAFENKSMGRPASLLWLFPGGTPSSSTADAPIVTYNTPGVYDVKMIATTGLTNDTVLKTGYITVNPCAILTTPTGPIVVCTNYPGTTYSYTTEGLADTYTWELNPASGAGTLSPDGATCIVNWTPNWTGIASIRVRGTNIYGLGPWSGYLDVTCSICTDVAENQSASMLSVYPNPANANINITMNAKVADQVSIQLINTQGKVVYAEKSVHISGSTSHAINVSALSHGTYMLKVTGSSFNASAKVNIQR